MLGKLFLSEVEAIWPNETIHEYFVIRTIVIVVSVKRNFRVKSSRSMRV